MIPWILAQKELIAEKGSDVYRPASQQELAYFGQEVVRPLLELIGEHLAASVVDQQVKILDAAARPLNYRVFLFHEPRRNARYIVLSERWPQERYWATYVFRFHAETPFVWEVPHPRFERNTFEFATTSFVRHHSLALLVPGAHRHANPDQCADVVPGNNPHTLFNLVHQSLILELMEDPLLVIQCRAIRDPVASDITIACDQGARSADELSFLKFDLHQRLLQQNATVGFVDGGFDTAGYELGNSSQLATMHFSPAKEFMGLWLSPSLRSQFRLQSNNYTLQSQIAAVGIPIEETDLLNYLQTSASPQISDEDFDVLRDELGQYLQNRDIVQLYKVIRGRPQFAWKCVLDRETQLAFLVVITGRSSSGSDEVIVANMADTRSPKQSVTWFDDFTQTAIDQFLSSDSAWLVRRNDQ